jgi:hypothetical protein
MTETRRLNPLAAMTLVLVYPRRTFERLVERPRWILPLAFVVGATMVGAVYAARAGFMDELLASQAAAAGIRVEDARAQVLTAGVLGAALMPLVMLLAAVLYRLAGTLAGGRSSFRVVFSAVAHASIPVGIGAVIVAGFMHFTGSSRAGLNLGFIVEPVQHPYLWSLLRQIDLFSIWFFALLGVAAEPVFGLSRGRARVATVAFAIAYVLIMSWSGPGAVGPGM